MTKVVIAKALYVSQQAEQLQSVKHTVKYQISRQISFLFLVIFLVRMLYVYINGEKKK